MPQLGGGLNGRGASAAKRVQYCVARFSESLDEVVWELRWEHRHVAAHVVLGSGPSPLLRLPHTSIDISPRVRSVALRSFEVAGVLLSGHTIACCRGVIEDYGGRGGETGK